MPSLSWAPPAASLTKEDFVIGEMLPVTTPEEAASYRKLGVWRDQTLFGRFEAAARAIGFIARPAVPGIVLPKIAQ